MTLTQAVLAWIDAYRERMIARYNTASGSGGSAALQLEKARADAAERRLATAVRREEDLQAQLAALSDGGDMRASMEAAERRAVAAEAKAAESRDREDQIRNGAMQPVYTRTLTLRTYESTPNQGPSQHGVVIPLHMSMDPC